MEISKWQLVTSVCHACVWVKGVKIGSAEAYVRYPNRRDLVIFEFAAEMNVTGVFTRKRILRAAPVDVSKAHLAAKNPRYLVINTGNANAGTGKLGMQNAQPTCATVGSACGSMLSQEVLPFSTGVYG